MPVFQETADASRDFRILPSIELPLPRLSPRPAPPDQDGVEKYEVVVIGAGPAGLMLTLLLARYGLSSTLACFDAKPGTLKAGQADGLQPRTLEVLKSLDVADEILNHGCHMSEVAFWNPKQQSVSSDGFKNSAQGQGNSIERTSFVPDVVVASRYMHEVTIHQGRIERILEENLLQYAKHNPIQRSSKFLNFKIDASSDAEFPISVEVEQVKNDGSTQRKTVRTKYLIGADGAHSQVRRTMGLKLEGETTDHIWGVMDFVADTDFPDVRKRSAIHSDAGSVMIIPRERIASGHYLTRLYVQIKDEVPAEENNVSEAAKLKSSQRRSAITMEYILDQARRVLAPYTITKKPGTAVDWWAAYQIGQRMTSEFSVKDDSGQERVFIVGDACHTHSPKAGQGMNVSMMDSYNLAWKLAHTIHGLCPPNSSSVPTVLSTFNHERLTIARQLIEFDTKFSSMFSGQIGSDTSVEGLTHEQFLKVFSDGSGFTSGCGIEYPAGILVTPGEEGDDYPVEGDDYLQGVLRPGRRLLDAVVRRFADANVRHLQDEFLSTGRYRILVFTTPDLIKTPSVSKTTLSHLCTSTIPSFPASTIELVVLHPFTKRCFEWADLPPCVKEYAEMSLLGPLGGGLGPGEEGYAVYGTYGVDTDRGATVVGRPDGYVGLVVELGDVQAVEVWLGMVLVRAGKT